MGRALVRVDRRLARFIINAKKSLTPAQKSGRSYLKEWFGDPTGEVAVPHHHPSQFAVHQAGDAVTGRGASEADRFRASKSPVDMKLFKFKPDD